MKIYEVDGDHDYAWINCCDIAMCGLLNHVVHDGAEIDRSQPVALEVGGYGRKGDWIETDCPKEPAYGTLMLSDHAVAVFGPMLTDAGYLLDTTLDAQTRYKLSICEREIDALDQARSEFTRFSDGGISYMLRYELEASLLQGMDVFRLKYRRARVFVSDRFKALAEAHGLTGFVFDEVWSSDTGGVPLTIPMPPIERVRGEFGRLARQKRQALRQELARRAATTTA